MAEDWKFDCNMIKTIRITKKKRLSEVAEALGITRQGYTDWETGKCNPNMESLEKLSKVFDVKPSIFFVRRTP